jgi:hypothetical protein
LVFNGVPCPIARIFLKKKKNPTHLEMIHKEESIQSVTLTQFGDFFFFLKKEI